MSDGPLARGEGHLGHGQLEGEVQHHDDGGEREGERRHGAERVDGEGAGEVEVRHAVRHARQPAAEARPAGELAQHAAPEGHQLRHGDVARHQQADEAGEADVIDGAEGAVGLGDVEFHRASLTGLRNVNSAAEL